MDRICEILDPAIGKMFGADPPKNETDLNTKIGTLLNSHEIDLRREHPAVSFAGGHTVPDHGGDDADVLIEAKYVRGATSPSRVSDGIAADTTKYPQDRHTLFVVYDPQRIIKDDQLFKTALPGIKLSSVIRTVYLSRASPGTTTISLIKDWMKALRSVSSLSFRKSFMSLA